jgi:hypothetical protein
LISDYTQLSLYDTSYMYCVCILQGWACLYVHIPPCKVRYLYSVCIWQGDARLGTRLILRVRIRSPRTTRTVRGATQSPTAEGFARLWALWARTRRHWCYKKPAAASSGLFRILMLPPERNSSGKGASLPFFFAWRLVPRPLPCWRPPAPRSRTSRWPMRPKPACAALLRWLHRPCVRTQMRPICKRRARWRCRIWLSMQ